TNIVIQEGALKGKAIQSQSLYALMKFKKPNKIALEMTAPTGSLRVYCDGKDFYVYSPLTNQFTRDPAPATGRQLAQTLFQRAGIIAAFDPLYFLTQGALPPELG